MTIDAVTELQVLRGQVQELERLFARLQTLFDRADLERRNAFLVLAALAREHGGTLTVSGRDLAELDVSHSQLSLCAAPGSKDYTVQLSERHG